MLDLLLPTTCVVCGRQGSSPCAGCASALVASPPPPVPPGLVDLRALVVYQGAGARLVTGLKYGNHRVAVGVLGEAMAALIDDAASAVRVVTWAPTSAGRRRRRGFDQAELLARAVARCLGRPCRALLRRTPGLPQTALGSVARWAGPSFTAARPARTTGRPVAAAVDAVLLVDDVCTTGATLAAAARTLHEWGASSVHGLVLAHTPARSGAATEPGQTGLKERAGPAENVK